MSEIAYPLPGPEQPKRPELYEENGVFANALTYQREFDTVTFRHANEAAIHAHKCINELDKLVVEGKFMGAEATLLGPDVVIPRLSVDRRTGSIMIEPTLAADIPDGIIQAHGNFRGFVGYAMPVLDDPDAFRPVLGVQILSREILAPNFSGKVTAYGPVANTAVSFTDDSLTKLAYDNLL